MFIYNKETQKKENKFHLTNYGTKQTSASAFSH